jgi:antitoxin CcdA
MTEDTVAGGARRAGRDTPRRSINISRDHGLAPAVREGCARRWREENQAAFESSNLHVERRGLPLARYRQF